MADRKYYVRCESGCLFESMTKEQILTAITEAISTGEIKDVDTGFITTVKEQNAGGALSFWVGTQAEYNALPEKSATCFYIITDDTSKADIENAIKELREEVGRYKAGLLPEIVINAIEGENATCKDANGAEIIGAHTGDKWTFQCPKFGTYTVTGNYKGLLKTITVDVDTVKQYKYTLEYYDETFENNSWERIVEVIQRGVVPATWKVGDGKEMTVEGKEKNCFVRIIGKNHDTYINGEKAPFTFMFQRNSYSTVLPTDAVCMNTEATNVGGWASCTMRTVTMLEILSLLPEEVRAGIREVKKATSVGNTSAEIEITNDGLFLLSEVERFGSTLYSAEGEGAIYEYFANGNKEFYSSTNTARWVRSPSINDALRFCTFTGSTTNNVTRDSDKANSTGYYNNPAFCF